MAVTVKLTPPWLQVDLGYPHRLAGWPIVGPAWGEAVFISWLQVEDAELPLGLAPDLYFRRRAKEARIAADLGLMTAADVRLYCCEKGQDSAMEVTLVVTAGLTNGESVQPQPRRSDNGWHPGTINILMHANVPLTDAALMEAMSIVTEARTAAVIDLGITLLDGRKLTGTGTDCVLVAAPALAHPLHHCGLHTALGRLIGETTYRAVTHACRERDTSP